MTQRTSPGLWQWLMVTFSIIGVSLLLYKLYQYGSVRQNFPAGLEVAGVNVGGYSRAEAEQLLSNRYLAAPVVVRHGNDSVEISPTQIEFTLDFETMLSQAQFQRDQQDYWAGFWGFLWNRPVAVEPVDLVATHNSQALREVLETIAEQMDTPPQEALPETTTMSFNPGSTGMVTNLEASLPNVAAAFYRPRNRTADLMIDSLTAPQPERNLLENMLLNQMQEFENSQGGVGSLFILDLNSGEEFSYNADLPMSGMELLKIPIALEVVRLLDDASSAQQASALQAMLTETGQHTNANTLLGLIAGNGDPFLGVEMVTDTLHKLGLINTYLGCPYDEGGARCRPFEPLTENERTLPDEYRQTTAEDMGTLLAALYQCAELQGGVLVALFGDAITPTECQLVLDALHDNHIGSLIEEGVPPDTPVAHRHAWQNDTYADAGIVYSPSGPYVLVEIVHKPGWLAWTISSPLLADISQAVYNFFNFSAPYLNARSN